MKTATVKELKQALSNRSSKELLEYCLRLSKFKKDNKELLTYLLFEADDETAYIEQIKQYMDEQFAEINTSSHYFINKSVRKILNQVKKNIRYSAKKETTVELLLYFCTKLKHFSPAIKRIRRLHGLYDRQILLIQKTIGGLHEDLQYDYGQELAALKG